MSKTSVTLDAVLRAVLALLTAGSAISEALGLEPVTRSLEVLGYPMYLLPALAVTKLAAVVALVAPVPRWVRDWAYAGLVFDFALATYSFARVGQFHLPDVILAPSYLLLALASFFVGHRRSLALVPTPAMSTTSKSPTRTP